MNLADLQKIGPANLSSMAAGYARIGSPNAPHITGLPAASKAQVPHRVQSCVPFDYNHTLYASVVKARTGVDLYVVWSYGQHFPLAATVDTEVERKFWYVNGDPATPTTGRHRGMVLDGIGDNATQLLTTDELQTIIEQITEGKPCVAHALFELGRPTPEDFPHRIR